ncbi:MAG: thioredoxin-dependent thiol peroxidase [Myxococcales bacterium]|nr:thioredoxin-dependent thiol peroxidase [Myxococcales bacterium]MCB9520761.1 thioredoxin-dependent thiol peroxidase [Myxococcales bacterium]MCB9533478.1 thioredoxin-dependent thiol peroxidase [Myxococcales bacterium]
MIPAVGAPAPDFTLPDASGHTVSLSELRGHRVVLYFYPKDDTPGCTAEACDFRDSLPALQALGAVVVGVSADPPKRHARFRDKYDLPFSLLSDEAHATMEAYGVWQTKKQYGREYMGIARTTFLIDGAGVIRRVWEKVAVQRKDRSGAIVHRHVDEVRQALEVLDT